MQPFIILMAVGTVLLDVAIVLGILGLFRESTKRKIFFLGQQYGLLAIFILSTLAVVGTLLMDVGGLSPCLFCWWQRVCMYPVAFISAIAFFKNTKISDVADYVIALSVIGALIALYQHFLQILPAGSLIPCDPAGECAIRSVFEFNFVTIPWMALTVFAALIFVAFLARTDRSNEISD